MSKAKRKRIEKEAAKNAAVQEVSSGWSYKRVITTVIVIFVVLIAGIITLNHYFSEDQRYLRTTIIEVDGDTISMDYFVRRCYATGTDPIDAITNLAHEMVIKKEAEAIGLEFSDDDVENRLIELATGTSENITQSEFKEWYRQALSNVGLSDAEYRDIIDTSMKAEFFYNAIGETMPTTTEQVHLHFLQTDSMESALEIKARWEAGEDFADLARELSIDKETSENGGDVGWVPRGVILDSWLDETAFGLEIGVMSEPVEHYIVDDSGTEYETYYYLIMVTEKDDSHEISEEYLSTIQGNIYDEWLNEVSKNHEINTYGIKDVFDSETYYWITWQLQRLAGE